MNTALVLACPQADPLTHDMRLAHDPSAADGMTAHVTLLYPFKSVSTPTEADKVKLSTIAARQPRFDLTFNRLARFPGVLWLAPALPQPVIDLTLAISAAFPECPRSGGAHHEIVPHLTLAHLTGDDAETRLDQLAAAFSKKAEGHLPLRQSVLWVSLFDRSETGRWREVSGFPLRG